MSKENSGQDIEKRKALRETTGIIGRKRNIWRRGTTKTAEMEIGKH